jgi:hypothetical protein
MKTAVKTTNIIASDNLESSVMGMDAAGMDMATFFFHDKIYNNKIEAVVREYVCNAIDEHKKFGIDKPVDYTLTEDNTFSVRDYAGGLSEDGVRKIFGMYFRSTKSGSNDSIGGFGVGSKAGHAYTDSFNILSHHDGQATTYVCALGGGDNGVPVGHIYKMGSVPSKETGVEISLTVKDDDCESFGFEMKQFHMKSHGNIRLSIGNNVFERNKIVCQVEKDGLIIRVCESMDLDENFPHTGRGLNRNYAVRTNVIQPIHIKMGDVSYGDLKEKIDSLSDFMVAEGYVASIECPIGSLNIPVSRESISDTKPNEKYLAKVSDVFHAFLQEQFKDYTELSTPELFAKVCNGEKAKEMRSVLKAEFFTCGWKDLLGDYLGGFAQNIAIHSHQEVKKLSEVEHDKKSGKPIIVETVNQKSAEYWVDKVNNFAEATKKKYFVYQIPKWRKGYMEDPAFRAEIEKDFTVIEAKKLPYPKSKSTSKKSDSANVVWSRGSNVGLFDALTLHNRIMKENDHKVVASIEDAQKQIKAFRKDISCVKVLAMITIAAKKTVYGTYNNCVSNYFINAKALKEGMKDLGYYFESDSDWVMLAQKIRAAVQTEHDNDRICKVMTHENGEYLSDKTKERIMLSERNKTRWTKAVEQVKERNTLSKLILDQVSSSWYSQFKYMTRKELRFILTSPIETK